MLFLSLVVDMAMQVEVLGANIAANGSREQMSYTIDCLRWYLTVHTPTQSHHK